jgi:phosphate transport system protein
MTTSIRSNYDRELNEIHELLKEMAQAVDRAIERAMKSLREQDIALAAGVMADDQAVNALRFKIEEACFLIIATQQPIASDLRTIIAVMHSVVELERMGDHAAGIAKTVIKASDTKALNPGKKLNYMADVSREMLGDCIQAFLTHDAERARQIADRDAEMDRLYKSVFDRLIKVMSEHPKLVERATYLMWCGHNLERIADRVTNLAEQVIFMSTGDLKEIKD